VATSETERFEGFFKMLGHTLEPFQRLIVEEVFGERRETLVLIPRGNGKSTLMAAVALWCLLRKQDAQIVVGAASRDQAAILFDIARGFAQHREIAPLVETTRREIRTSGGWLKVIAADGPRQHGLILDMAICDELHAHARRDLYDALRTSMLKRPGARMVTISTAGATVDTPLGELRDRALKLPKVTCDGPFTRAEGDHLAMLQWALAEGAELADVEAVKACNPAPWITLDGLREQLASVHELAFARYHANVWTGGEAPWISADVWDACSGAPDIPEGAPVVVGVDASIRHDTTAIVVVRATRTTTCSTRCGAPGHPRRAARCRCPRSRDSCGIWPRTSASRRSCTTPTISGTRGSGSRTRESRCWSGSTPGWRRRRRPCTRWWRMGASATAATSWRAGTRWWPRSANGSTG
jgi:phage terminase large subunit-like protein